MGWIRVDLEGARIVFSDRRGGVSSGPFSSLNLSVDAGDEPDAVEANRARVTTLVGHGGSSRWVPIRQVHGTGVVVCGEAVPSVPVEADAVVLTAPGPVGAVVTADCLPLVLVSGGGVAAVHVGWRGLVAGVVERAVSEVAGHSGPVRHAVAGPCIHSCCYEFGRDDLEMVVERLGAMVRGRTRFDRPALDLRRGVSAALARSGVHATLRDVGVCTACSPDYFSHRRDGRTGRQGVLVTRLPEG